MLAKKLSVLGPMFAFILLFSTCTFPNTQTRESSFEVGKSPRVEADVALGQLSVRSGSDGQVHVKATLRFALQTKYQVVQSGDTIQIQADMRTDFTSKLPYSPIEIMLTVPRETDLILHTSTGDLYADEVSGHIMLTTSSGGIQLSDSEGQIELQTQTGSIACRRVQGAFAIQSSTGNIDLQNVSGSFNVETDTGAIKFKGELASTEQHYFKSNTGSIDLQLLGHPALYIDVASETGSVHCGLDMIPQVSTERECKGVLGSGQGRVQVRTSTGSINIH